MAAKKEILLDSRKAGLDKEDSGKESNAQKSVTSFASLEKSGAPQAKERSAGGRENRKYKDSVFVDLFYEDETAQKNLLSLYNALHDTDYQDESCIHKVRIEDCYTRTSKMTFPLR